MSDRSDFSDLSDLLDLSDKAGLSEPFALTDHRSYSANRHMSIDYDKLAPGYDCHRRGGGPYGETLVRLARQTAAARGDATPPLHVLELGAGTGLNTAFFLGQIPCRVVALERSAGMLARGAAKRLPVSWMRASAEALPFRPRAFDFLFSAYMLHHIVDLGALFRECRRVVRPGGRAALVTVSHEFIGSHPMNQYFPSFARIDLQRFQPIAEVAEAMRAAGFREAIAINDVDVPRPVDASYVERVANRFISTYDLIPAEEFACGVQKLRDDLATGGGKLPLTIAREATTVTGQA
ncbi:MAG: class I SAM-dependent methyltransferase [Candidatus Hydrogenedentes bacterium]|nr:class I SAM-dependent methyltransferase [Candidatus Hydrogenedentota bacterium]